MSRDTLRDTTILISDPNSPATPQSHHSSPHESSVEKHTHSDNDPQTDSNLPAATKQTEELSVPEQAVMNRIEWTAELDVALLYALQNHKLVGSNKYFHMICVHDAFTRNAGIRCTISCLWDRVSQWYDLELLADNELNPFPVSGPKDFSLPEHFSRAQPLEASALQDSEGEPTPHRLRSLQRPK